MKKQKVEVQPKSFKRRLLEATLTTFAQIGGYTAGFMLLEYFTSGYKTMFLNCATISAAIGFVCGVAYYWLRGRK